MKPYQRRKETAFLGTVLPIIMSRTTLNYSAAVAVSAAVTVTVVVVVGDDDDDDGDDDDDDDDDDTFWVYMTDLYPASEASRKPKMTH